MRAGRGRLVLAVLLLVSALGAVLLGAAATPARAQTVGELTARIELTSIGPSLVDPTQTLTVTGLITNTGTAPLELASARLRLARASLGTRAQVAAWSDGTDERSGLVVGPTLDVEPRSIPVAATAPFALSVPASQLGLAGQPFGAYGLAVEVRAQGELGRQRVALTRTTMQWQPGSKEYEVQRISWLVPITGLPAGPDLTPAQLAAAVAPGSRLRRVLAAASAPGVAWALDPALLQALEQVAAVPVPAENSAPTPPDEPAEASRAAATSFLADLRTAAVGREVLELPYADPDLSAVTAGGRADLVRAAQAAGAGIIEQVLGITPVAGVGWPADGWAGDETLSQLAQVGLRDVVLDARSRRLVDPLPYTTDARAELAGPTGAVAGVTGWLADPTLSSLAAEARRPDVLRVQRLLAETAATTSERPGLARRLLVAAPRNLDPDPAAFGDLVSATSRVPWLTVVPVTALRTPAAGSGGTADLPRHSTAAPASVDQAQLSAQHVAAVRRMRGSLAAIGEAVEPPNVVTDVLQRSSLALLSSSWRGRPEQLTERRAAVAQQVATLTNKVHVLASSVNFLASSGRLQITVANDLPQAVSGLRLRVTSTNPRLRVPTGEVATPALAANTRAQVQVPVQAIASGAVLLNAQLVSASGRPLGQSVQVRVRVQPTDTWALWVLGAVAALVFLVGLVRTLRRPRRARVRFAQALADADQADLHADQAPP